MKLSYDRAVYILKEVKLRGGIRRCEFKDCYGLEPKTFRKKCAKYELPEIQYVPTYGLYKVLENAIEYEIVSEHLGKVANGVIRSFKKTAKPIITVTHNPLIKQLARMIAR